MNSAHLTAPPIAGLTSDGVRTRLVREGRKASGNVAKYLLMSTSSNFGNMLSMAVASVLVPFLPMLPTQILVNNFLYDLSQITLPSDHVDASHVATPQRWDMHQLRHTMVRFGAVSSVF